MSALDWLARKLGPLARENEPIGQRTTYRVGGTAALYVELASEKDLESLSDALSAVPVPVLVLGNGSNLLVADTGFAGLCVSLGDGFSSLDLNADGFAHAGGALAYPVLARRCAAAALAGMSWAVGIPGSVGGAVAMNAGGHGAETAERLVVAEIVDLASGARRELATSELDLSYRHSNLVATDLVVRARFSLSPGRREALEAEVAEIVAWRREHQPGGHNGGSVFSNPTDDAAGRLVEAAGLKGYRVGGAVVSDKHANFIQAESGATASDVRMLIEQIQSLVAKRCGVELALELRLVGFDR